MICFRQTEPTKVQTFRLSTARMKINQVSYVIFQATSLVSFKFCIIFQCHDTKFLWNFLAELLQSGQNEPSSKYKFWDFACFNETSPNSSCQFWNHKVKVSSNFVSLFSVMKETPLYFFSSNLYTLDKKQFSEWLGENSPNSLCHVWNYKL